MNIIREGREPELRTFRADCPYCDSRFEFVRGEARLVSNHGNCFLVYCPICWKTITKAAP